MIGGTAENLKSEIALYVTALTYCSFRLGMCNEYMNFKNQDLFLLVDVVVIVKFIALLV